MNTLPYVLLVLAVLCFLIGSWIEIRTIQNERKHGINPRHIATVCMQCNRRIAGPPVGLARFVSHGLCTACGDQWRSELITHDRDLTFRHLPAHHRN